MWAQRRGLAKEGAYSGRYSRISRCPDHPPPVPVGWLGPRGSGRDLHAPLRDPAWMARVATTRAPEERSTHRAHGRRRGTRRPSRFPRPVARSGEERRRHPCPARRRRAAYSGSRSTLNHSPSPSGQRGGAATGAAWRTGGVRRRWPGAACPSGRSSGTAPAPRRRTRWSGSRRGVILRPIRPGGLLRSRGTDAQPCRTALG